MTKWFIAVVAVVILGGAVGPWWRNQSATPVVVQTNSQRPLSGSRYVDYSPEAFATVVNKRRVLYFWAAWCPTCKVTHQDLVTNSGQLPSDVVVFKTNYDTEAALKQKYGITYQHTFVQVDENGNQVAKWNGGSISDLLTNLK